MTLNKNYRKYFVIFDNDKKWGFYINDVGSTKIKKDDVYPSKGHPGRYMFTWEKGRILNEFHFVLITNGKGVFESKETGEKKYRKVMVFCFSLEFGIDTNPLKISDGRNNGLGFREKLPNSFFLMAFLIHNSPLYQNATE